MKVLVHHKLYLILALAVLFLHLLVAAFAKPSFPLTIFGDALPCALLVIAIFAAAENFRGRSGILALFWKLTAATLIIKLLSQSYWFYFDYLRQSSSPSPVLGDALLLLSNVFFLSALAIRPHSSSAGGDLRIRRLDLLLLTLWWFTLYSYFSIPWQFVVQDFSKYNPTYYFLTLSQHSAIVIVLCFLFWRNPGPWRRFYGHLIVAFGVTAAGELLMSIAIDRGLYYSGGFFDTLFLIALVWFTFAASLGPTLVPKEDSSPNRELNQSVWTARVAMLAVLSLPLIALLGFREHKVTAAIAVFRLRIIFGAVFLIGVLVFLKLNLLARELVRLVRLTSSSIANLRTVQEQVAHSEKLAALGRLASGATHEISNPLTAILGYSELLADIPSLSPQDRKNAEIIRQQVHHAQAAVNSLRNTLRKDAPSPPSLDKTFSS